MMLSGVHFRLKLVINTQNLLQYVSYHQEVYRLSRIIEFLLHVWASLLVLDLQLSF